ncbi:hypothetical protein HLB23_36275 [Nocardia uniformis]|uniref:Uncharacterized protein n=1 Tax=Nocardia uniformis TaxID=53432 RepID=A0A849CH71_9NOCA|nr:PxKF domain-containing protein [Nocardia uniformis]NNH75249.1 hypothetical protein [Nocardia uniformis]
MTNSLGAAHSALTVPASPAATTRRGLMVLASAAALAVSGSLVAAPAHADALVQIAGPASPVPTGTPYTYTVTVPSFPDDFLLALVVDLSGAAATFTGVSNNGTMDCTASGTHALCLNYNNTPFPAVVTLTVLPTATGTVTANAVAEINASPDGTDSTTTTIGNPAFPFTGFFAPVDNPPTVNTMKAGAAVPVKFGLGGDQGLNIFASGSPASQQVDCQSGATTSPVEETVTAGGNSLSYDSATSRYNYVWKTDKAWAGTCRTLDLNLTDGTDHTAHFAFD